MSIAIDLDKVFDYAVKINIYTGGAMTVYGAGDKAFKEILVSWKSMIDGAYRMPAFGVTLDKLTKQEKQKGVWVEFEFGNIYECDGLPFEKLLVSVKESFSGFNLIRYTSDRGYDGRCFYYDLVGKNMDDFYNILLSL